MASREVSILAALRTGIAAIDGTGSYNYTLTGTDCVTVGDFVIENSLVPRVSVMAGDIGTGEAGAMTYRRRTLQIDVVGVAVPTEQTPAQRTYAALYLLTDIRQKIEAMLLVDRLSGLVIDLEFIAERGVDGANIGFGEVGVAHVELLATWDAAIGGGAA